MNPKLLGSLLVGIIVLTGVYIGSLSLSQNPLTRESLESQQAQVSSALTNGLISHWKFDEGSGNSVSSAVGGASDTLGSPVWIDGKIGKALTFNGSDYVSAGDISQSKITISAWIKPESNSNFGSIAMKQNVYGLESQGAKVFARVGDGSSWTGSVEAPISFGVWQLVTQTFDGSKVRIYVNGSLVATANAKVTLGSTVPFLIGTWATDFSEPFKGGVDDVRVYNRALSASEVSALYAYNGTTTPPPATDTTAPIISNVSSTNLKQTEATVTWTTNEASDTYVEFGLTPAYGNTSAVKDLGSAMVTSHTQTLVSLATNTTYNYRVTSKDAAGNSAVSGNYTFTTSPVPDTTAPTVPTAVTASNITQTSATISWTASTDAIGVTGYDVYRNGSKVGTATGASYNDSGLSANTKYSYTVTAFDAAGNTSAQSIAASVTTLANAPTVSLSATVASITSGQSTILNWSSTNATACTATGGTFAGQKGPSGSQTVYPTVTSTYGISCTGTGGTTSATPVTITVAAPEVSSLVSYWALNQTSGSTATDSSGNNKTATLVGGPVWTTGVAGNGLQFNGTSAYVNAGTVSLSSFTISAWVNMSSSQSGWGSIVMKQNSFGLEVQNGTVYANIGNGATWNNTVSTPLTAGAWKHVVQTYDGTTNRIYVDGVLKASGTGAFTNASSNLLIGSWNTTSEFFNGKIDEVQVYNKALTSTEVQSLYTSIVPPTNPTPTTYTVTVAKAGTGSGTVTSTGSINCGATCSSTGDAGQTVTLTAAPAAGSSFAGWTGVTSCSTSATCSFVLNSNITATATFNTVVAGTFTITTAKAGTGSGTVTCAPTTCTANTGSAVTVTAAAASGSTFVGWSGACTGTGACSLTSAGNVTATFNTIPVTTPNSTAFTASDRVASTDILNVRSSPSASATLLGTQALGALGTINTNSSNGVFADGYYWWNVNYDTGVDGWSVENYLVKYTPPTTPTPTGAIFYITPAGAGAKNGADWNNAFAGIPTTLVRGATYYFADGSYPSYNFRTAVDGTKTISFVKAIGVAGSAGHGTDVGYNYATMGAGQAILSSIDINSSYFVIDGQKGDGFSVSPADNKGSSYGFSFKSSNAVNAGTTATGNFTDISIRHVYAAVDTTNAAAAGGGWFFQMSSANRGYAVNNLTISKSYFYGWGQALNINWDVAWNNITWEYNVYEQMYTSPTYHGNPINVLWAPVNNLTVRYSLFSGTYGQGGLSEVVSANGNAIRNSKIYGNVFEQGWSGRAVIAGNCVTAAGGVFNTVIYNNTFLMSGYGKANDGGGVAGDECSSGNVFQNNLVYYTNADIRGGVSHDYNHFVFTTNTPTEPNRSVVTTNTDPFVNYVGKDYRLKAGTPAGNPIAAGGNPSLSDANPLTSGYDFDALGRKRTNWTRGAYEYTGAVTTPTTFTVTTAKAGTGSGTVTCAPTTCTANTGSAVTVTAAAASGSTFVGWSGACTGTGACSLTSAGNVTATFNTIPVTGGTVFYIREGATGNGTDWTNAYGSFPPTLVRGATYYVADGVYAAYNFDDAVNGTQLITIKKAIQSDHGTDTGWATTYGDGRAQLGALTFSTDYYVIDGQKGSGSTNLADRDYGFYIKSGGTIISSDGSANYITIKRTEIEGTGRDGGTAADTTWPSNKGFFLSGTHTNWTMSQIYLHDTGNMSFQWASLSNSIIDKSYIARNESTAAAHAEGVYGFGSGNVISNNVWEDIEGTGVVMISGNNWKIYNNVMFWTTAYTGEGTGNGAVGDWSDSSTGSSASNNLIYSNTIINQKGYSSGFNFIHTGSTGNVASNNLRYLASSGSNTTGTNNITATVDPFVNWQARDFRLNSSSSAINAGATLGSEYASDLIGTPRPQGSAFDAGAYEFTGTVTTPTTPNSVKFAVNDRVASTDILNVRSNPSSSATLLGAQALGALGTINANASNGVFADGYYWWNINYDAGVDGWSVENYLVKYTPPTTPTPTGTTFYITPAGAGAKNGADWNNAMAWSSFTPSRGATYYVAGGSYSGRDFATAVSGSSYITIKKAIASDHGTDTGWVSTYGTTQASITGVVSFNTDYWIIDGSIRNESDWFDATSYGFRISGSQQQIYVGKNSSYIQVKNLVFEQPATLETAAVRRYSLDLYSFGGYPKTQQGIVVARSYFKNGNVPIFAGRTTNEYISGMLVEYTAFDNTKSNANNHGEAISCYYNGCGKDFVIRFNKFRGISGTAIIAMTGADNFQFYGNVIWNSDIGDGILGFSEPTRSNFTNSKVFNNTIVDRVSGWNEGVAFQTGSNNLVYNNLWFNTSQSNGATLVHGGGVTNNYNAYDDSSYTGTEPNIQKGLTSAIFNGYTADDFTLKVNTAAGIDLSKISGYVSAWSQDITGKTRSTWSRGAYEYN